MSKKIIINADDFGYSKVFNEVILGLLECKLITSTSVMVSHIDDSQFTQIQKLKTLHKNNQIGIGLHFIPNNINVILEIEDQYEKFILLFGFAPSHIDVHKPEKTEEFKSILVNFCKLKNIYFRNLGFEDDLNTTTHKYINGTDLNIQEIDSLLQSVKEKESIEILFHPGKYDNNCPSSLNKQREDDVFKIIQLQGIIEKYQFIKISFYQLNQSIKSFNTWSSKKVLIESKDTINLFPKEKEVWMINLGLNIGFEQDGSGANYSRPVLIIKKFNNNMFWILPLSTKQKKIDFYYNFEDLNSNKVSTILSQIKLVSIKRFSRKMYDLDSHNFANIKELLLKFIN